ncbi:hypothetical protein HY950_04005 [Candidatus Gottesmanbacteria bacterium]|nr:hypothetical protein [Candidatus Gottesmanbacteria bacterium]
MIRNINYPIIKLSNYQINKFKKLLGYWVIGLLDNSRQRRAGQVVLILVLVTIVGLTIGLSLVSRTVTDIRISSQIEQSNRAFSAAEAGVESALKGAVVGGPTGTVSFSGASANYQVSQFGGNDSTLSFPLTETANTQTVWLIDHDANGNNLNEAGSSYSPSASFDLCFGAGTTSNPAVVVSLYYKDGSSYKVAKAAYDPTSIVRTPVNNFYQADTVGGYCGGNFRYKKTITPTSPAPDGFGIAGTAKLLFLRIQPVYEHTALAFKPAAGNSLPIQGKVITSVGQTTTGTVRRIQVYQGYPVLPTLLDFGIFSEN